jgi:hypothetical protein
MRAEESPALILMALEGHIPCPSRVRIRRTPFARHQPRRERARHCDGVAAGTRRHGLTEGAAILTDRDGERPMQIVPVTFSGRVPRRGTPPGQGNSSVEVRPPADQRCAAVDHARPCRDAELAEYARRTWVATVHSLMWSWAAICLLRRPRATRDAIWSSRAVRISVSVVASAPPQPRRPHDAELLVTEHEPRELIGGRCSGLSLGPPAGWIRRWQVHNQVVLGRQVQLAHDLGV